jgi:hypothetical protein
MDSKYTYPYCVRPLFFIETEEQAGDCGQSDGIIYALIFGLVIMVLGGRFFYWNETDPKRKFYTVLSILMIMLGGLIVIPMYYKNGYKVAFRGYADVKTKLDRDGIDKYKAIEFIKAMETSNPSSGLSLAAVLMASKKEEKKEKTE